MDDEENEDDEDDEDDEDEDACDDDEDDDAGDDGAGDYGDDDCDDDENAVRSFVRVGLSAAFFEKQLLNRKATAQWQTAQWQTGQWQFVENGYLAGISCTPTWCPRPAKAGIVLWTSYIYGIGLSLSFIYGIG